MSISVLMSADAMLGILSFVCVVFMIVRSFTFFEMALLTKLAVLALAVFGIWDMMSSMHIHVEDEEEEDKDNEEADEINENEDKDDEDNEETETTSTDNSSEFSDLVEPHTKKIVE